MVGITGNVAITGGSISVTPSYLPLPTFVTTATGSGNNLVTVNWNPTVDGGTWGVCGYQVTSVPYTTFTNVLNTTSAVVVVPNTTTYFKFVVTPYNYVGLGSIGTTSTIAAGSATASPLNSNLYNLPISAPLSATPIVISSSTQTIVITVNSVTNTAPAISTYATDISINPGGTTATVLNTNVGIGSGVYNSTGTVTFTGLTPATSYVFSSQAYNAIGYANSVTLTTSTYNLPTTPSIGAASISASAINVTVNSAQNCWSLPTVGVIVTASPGGQQKTLVSTNSTTNVVPSSNSTGVLSFTGLSAATSYNFVAQAFNTVGFDTNTTNAGATTGAVIVTGSQSYTAAGCFSFIVPAGVTSVSVVAVGAGGRGMGRNVSNPSPGGNSPGGVSTFNYPGFAGPNNVAAGAGGSYWVSPVSGGGPLSTPPGGTVISGTGGSGGSGSPGSVANCTIGRPGAGGGGAGGYAGAGGNGSTATGPGGQGGGGGGGSGRTYPAATGGGGGGGGVGIYGQGANGLAGVANPAATPNTTPGGGGGSNTPGFTGGANGSTGRQPSCSRLGGAGGLFGGGGGGSTTPVSETPAPPYNGVGGAGGALAYRNNITVTPGASIAVKVGAAPASPTSAAGARGAVRIIWPGNTRSFPSTCAGAP
jgi:hypothetical protein